MQKKYAIDKLFILPKKKKKRIKKQNVKEIEKENSRYVSYAYTKKLRRRKEKEKNDREK